MIVYILIDCVSSEERNVVAELSKLPEVVGVNGVMGKYDIFTKVVGKIPWDIDFLVMKKRSIKGITDTYTMAILYGQGGAIDKELSNQ